MKMKGLQKEVIESKEIKLRVTENRASKRVQDICHASVCLARVHSIMGLVAFCTWYEVNAVVTAFLYRSVSIVAWRYMLRS